MKKILGTILSGVLGLSLFSFPVIAQPIERPMEVSQRHVVTDIDVLYDRAKNNITDLQLPTAYFKIINPKTQEEKKETLLSTTQLVKEVKYSSGKVEKKYVTTNFAVVRKNQLSSSATTPTKRTASTMSILGSTNLDKWDQTISVRAYSTMSWSMSGTKVQIDYVVGGWQNTDSQIGIKNRHVRMGQVAAGLPQIVDYYPSSDTFPQYNRPGSWVPVGNISLNVVGATTEANIYELMYPNSYWLLQLTNNVNLPV